ncbi:MetQ/NlpA family ABC transporter substrate-binding protein [Clostridium sp.]|uniref:MetQ/NlpA family ABC transporter substrate-binding protein n=1 Tax=Clostridium sp. TaxID=1506 RepID=UPI001A3B647B|nr:MetQ/NlpA family ABC transporter substrate-binding protein [Clostridium sp.]MBK5241866.1 MetQ/NlpA family ABC transporter substrate-binding protein [Clostridium sp.]
MKKILSVLLTIVVVLTVSGCGAKEEAATTEKKIIKVGASPVPHTEILEVVKPLLEKDGYTLEIVEFTDFVTPNTALAEGQIDANFFQHVPYLESFSEERGLDLDYTVKVHIEPMGLYSSKYKELSELKDGAEIAIPSDATNGARALRVLEAAGLIKLKDGDLISKLDITENPKNFKITELDAPQLPRVLKDVDAAVINSNFAIEADLNPTEDSLAIEATDSPYANVLAVRSEDKTKPYIEALSKALTSPEVKKFIEDKYKGNIIPAF